MESDAYFLLEVVLLRLTRQAGTLGRSVTLTIDAVNPTPSLSALRVSTRRFSIILVGDDSLREYMFCRRGVQTR